jgi:glyoxylate utilization-related uncharacterized protein
VVGLWLSFWGSAGIMVGVSIVDSLIKKYNRQSILVIVLTAIMGLSALFVMYDTKVKLESTDADLWEMSSFCE